MSINVVGRGLEFVNTCARVSERTNERPYARRASRGWSGSRKHANNAVWYIGMARPERNAFPPANRRDRFIDPSRHPSTRTKTDETKASRRCAYILPTINDRACLPALHVELCSRENSTGSSAASSYEVRSERETISTYYPQVGFPCYSLTMVMKNSQREYPSFLPLQLGHDNVHHQF